MLNEGIRVENVEKCFLCNSPGNVLYKNLRDYTFDNAGLWSLLQCPKCGLIWLNPRPLYRDIEKLYKNYYTHSKNIKISKITTLRKKIKYSILESSFGYKNILKGRIFSTIGRILSLLTPIKRSVERSIMWLDASQRGKLLDVGCGNGKFLAMMMDLGWEVQGIEPDRNAAKIAHQYFGIKVIASTLEESKIPDDSFDAITMSHVIEHTPNPLKLLRECNRILKPPGKLVVITPNIESLGCKIFKKSWLHLDVPRHFYLFSLKTLKSCAEQVGFRIKLLSTNSRSSSWMWANSRLIKSKKRGSKKTISKKLKIEGALFSLIEKAISICWKNAGEDLILIGTKN